MNIKVYSTKNCPYCHMAKDYFRDKGLEFEDIDVSKDKMAAMEMIEKSGQMGVPVIDIDGEIIIGFNVPKIESILDQKGESEKASEVADKTYDVIIVGGSAAGLTAALYASRREMRTLVLTKDIGGQIAKTADIENYSGIERIEGSDLAKVFEKQAKKFGAEIVMKEVTDLEKTKGDGSEDMFVVKTHDSEYRGRTVIIANGKTPRSLGVSGEMEFSGKGVSYCATCDAPLFRGKVVAVVGGGNSAFDAVLLLSKISKKVYLVHRRKGFRAFENVVKNAKETPNIEFVLDSTVEEIKGDDFVKSIVVKTKDNETNEITVDGVFIEVGSEVNTDFAKDLVDVDSIGQIKTNKNTETSHPGIFAAGDVTDTAFKQIIVAGGEGCKAALAAYNYIHGFENKYVTDWSTHTHNQ